VDLTQKRKLKTNIKYLMHWIAAMVSVETRGTTQKSPQSEKEPALFRE
jgi:hypothetical protein